MNKKENENKMVWIFGTIFLIITLIIFVPGLLSSKKELDTAKLEYNLIQEGKTISANIICEEVVEILKNRDEKKLNEYLANDFTYVSNSNYESKFISGFWNDLKYYTGKHYLEKRGNSIKDEETFWIYWDIPEQITKEQYSQYSLQRIFVYLRKEVEQDKVTYKIYKIILRNN